MTPTDEAVERVRGYVEACAGMPSSSTVAWYGRDSKRFYLGDLRALLSALELGRLDAEARLHVEAETVCEPADGWIEWAGGECPVRGGTRVEIKTRGDRRWVPNAANLFAWQHNGHGGDIIAYRLVTPAPPTGEGGGL